MHDVDINEKKKQVMPEIGVLGSLELIIEAAQWHEVKAVLEMWPFYWDINFVEFESWRQALIVCLLIVLKHISYP